MNSYFRNLHQKFILKICHVKSCTEESNKVDTFMKLLRAASNEAVRPLCKRNKSNYKKVENKMK